MADNLSVALRTICPFGFGLRHFAVDQDQNVKMSFRLVAVRMSATSPENVTAPGAVTLAKSEVHFAFLIFKGAFETMYKRGVHNAPDVSRIVY